MNKVRLICLESQREQVVTAMQRLNMIDLRKSRITMGDALIDANRLNALNEKLVRVQGALAVLTKRPPKVHQESLQKIMYSDSYTAALEEIYQNSGRIKELVEQSVELAHARKIALGLAGVQIDLSRLESERLTIRCFGVDDENLEDVRDELKKISHRIGVAAGGMRHHTALVVVAYAKGVSIEEVVKAHKLVEVELRSRYFAGTPEETLKSIDALARKNIDALAAARQTKEKLSDQYYPYLLSANESLQIEIMRLNAAQVFKKTDSTDIIEGWVPSKNLHEFESELHKVTGGRIYFEELHADHDELAPTLTRRPKFLRSYDYLVEFLAVPRSDEIDPTWVFIITFPIFYGFMVSDVGYGVLSMLLATYIKRITNPEGLVYNASTLWQLNGAAAIVFGFITNQYFGLQLNQYFTSFVGIDWLKSIPTLMVVAILFGVVQILLGLVIGFYNKMHHHERKMAVSKLTSMLMIVTGIVAICGALFGMFSYGVSMAAAAVAILSLVATMALSGQEAGEVPTLIAHILSYSRLMGFGLVSIIIAFLIDMAFTPALNGTGIGSILLFVVYLVIFLVLHVMNMIVSMFEAMVQAVRLNFVEFFTKFYMGGGVKFKPFSYKRVYTKE